MHSGDREICPIYIVISFYTSKGSQMYSKYPFGINLSLRHIFVKRLFTVWKFHDFTDTQILCVINFGDYRSAKFANYAI